MSLHSDNILLIKITTKKSTGFRCFSFAQKEETHGNQNQQRNSQLQGDCLLRSDSAAAYLFAAGGGYGSIFWGTQTVDAAFQAIAGAYDKDVQDAFAKLP